MSSPSIELYTWGWCPYCKAAKAMLDTKGQTYTEYDATDHEIMVAMRKRADGRTSVPQIFINDEHIGGFDDMAALNDTGELDTLLGVAG